MGKIRNKIFINIVKLKFINIFNKKRSIKKDIGESGQAGAEMILLIGGMIIIVLMAVYFYKDYLSELGNEMNSTELSKFNQSVENISSKFD